LQATWTPSQPAGLPAPPANWSFSSAVIVKSVFLGAIPFFASSEKKVPKALS
jgi:hypothetical protein